MPGRDSLADLPSLDELRRVGLLQAPGADLPRWRPAPSLPRVFTYGGEGSGVSLNSYHQNRTYEDK
jgi:hypothetical protein